MIQAMEGIALALALVRPLIEKLGNELWKKLGLLWDLDRELKKMKSSLVAITKVLDDAERKSIADELVRHWLWKLKDVAYDMDDLLDDFRIEAHRRSRNKNVKGKVRDFLSSDNHVAFSYKMVNRIKEMTKRLGEILEEKGRFQLTEGSVVEEVDERESFSAFDECEVYGRDEDRERIVDFLLHKDTDNKLSVLPIVGLGGLGKTTLAQLIINDQRIRDHFQPPACIPPIWVYVSMKFKVKEILRKIIECVSRKECYLSYIEPMQQEISTMFSRKKFLLILDDVWNEDFTKWEMLQNVLRCGGLGSKTIVTTRSEQVARIMSTLEPHRLQGLQSEDCWKLFRQRAFRSGSNRNDPRLENIGREIVDKCGGSPLAAKALGCLMGSRRGEVEWSAIRDSEIWEMPDDGANILPSLRLSYLHLPSNLKQCFVYCSLLPKGYRFHRMKLIQLWIIEGFIPSSKGGMHEEDIADQYFNNLQLRSFFQEGLKDNFGSVVEWTMHDLVHDLACYVAGPDFCIGRTIRENSDANSWRYSSLSSDNAYESRKLRSLLSFCSPHRIDKMINLEGILGLTYLRVLDLSSRSIQELPSEIGNLKHLRSLNLSSTDLKTLPKSITTLYNLEILDLFECHHLIELPHAMRGMSNLKMLDIQGCPLLDCMPHGMEKLTKLERLPLFIVGVKPGCSIAALQHLNLLKGELHLISLHNIRDPEEARKANLGEKTDLRSLILKWSIDTVCIRSPMYESPSVFETFESISMLREKDVLESMQPPPNLEKLVINYYNGAEFPSWMTSMNFPLVCSKLVEVELSNSLQCECLPLLGQLPCLKFLTLSSMLAVKTIGGEFYGDGGIFPKLEVLKLNNMPHLKVWFTVAEVAIVGKEMVMFPCLRELQISHCPSITVQPSLPLSIVKLDIDNSNEKQLLSERSLQGLSQVKTLNICNAGDSSSLSASTSYIPSPNNRSHLLDYDTDPGMLWESCRQELLSQQKSIINREMVLPIGSPRGSPGVEQVHESICQTSSSESSVKEGMKHLTTLQQLHISNCSDLEALPGKSLESSSQELISQHKSTMTKETVLSAWSPQESPRVEQPTEGGYQTSSPESGVWEGMQHLTTLQQLHISYCSELESLPTGFMQHHLPSLRTLTLSYMRKLMTLGGGRRAEEGPSKLQPPLCFTALQHLQISHCDALRELPEWLGGLVSLQSLALDHCTNLTTLPEGLECLTALQKVFIWRCPFLNYNGVFDHVPDVTIITWEETHPVLPYGSYYQDIIADTEELDSYSSQVIVTETKMDRSAGSCTNFLSRFCLGCTKGCSR
ncbi:disease resistance protein RGA2-like [Typha latifolia]|uniref:disease resistance protein RGA2-like n=1 Tax=Typha latifolia TaxID=4733 RepID=UPI003C2EBF85